MNGVLANQRIGPGGSIAPGGLGICKWVADNTKNNRLIFVDHTGVKWSFPKKYKGKR